jgi:YHS domain-containing protein
VAEFKTACGGIIIDTSKYPRANYRGERIYFCTQAYLDMFLSNPDPFMAGELEHPV